MRRALFCLLLLAVAGLAACESVAGPGGARRRAILLNIQVPATAGQADTVRVSFDYWVPFCGGTLEAIEVKPSFDSLSFTVWAREGNGVCPPVADLIVRPPTFVYLATPFRAASYSVIFHEPDGDSVRVVTAPQAVPLP